MSFSLKVPEWGLGLEQFWAELLMLAPQLAHLASGIARSECWPAHTGPSGEVHCEGGPLPFLRVGSRKELAKL